MKVGDFPGSHMSSSSHTGGHGKYAVRSKLQDNPYLAQELVWDLESGTKTVFQLPTEMVVKFPMGITEKYVWAVGGPYSGGDTKWLMRFKVE